MFINLINAAVGYIHTETKFWFWHAAIANYPSKKFLAQTAQQLSDTYIAIARQQLATNSYSGSLLHGLHSFIGLKMISNFYSINTENFLSFSTITTRGHNMKLFKPHANCLLRSSFFSVRVINDWNSLPQSVIDSNSPNQFKNLLDRHYCNIMNDF